MVTWVTLPTFASGLSKTASSGGEGAAQPVRLHPEVAVFHPVDQDHRHPVAVLGAVLGIGIDVDGRPLGAGFFGDRLRPASRASSHRWQSTRV